MSFDETGNHGSDWVETVGIFGREGEGLRGGGGEEDSRRCWGRMRGKGDLFGPCSG